MPRLPVVLGSPTRPTSSSRAFTSVAASCTMGNVTPGVGSRSMRSSSACSGSVALDGHTWNPRHAMFTAHSTWARSAATSARDVVPLGVLTIVVSSQPGALSGTRFWKNEEPPAPLGKRWSSTGRPPMAASRGPSTAW